MLNCMSYLHILESEPLWITSLANIFSPSGDCLFILFMISFAVKKLLNLMRPHLFIFVSTAITPGDESKISL